MGTGRHNVSAFSFAQNPTCYKLKPMNIDPAIFKAYDIRGTFPDQINAEVAEQIGRAFAGYLSDKGAVGVGRDMRLDSDELAKALIKGLTMQGRDVVDLGLISTDMAAFASGFYDLAGAAMITASHNPGKYNGIKLCGNQAKPIAATSGEQKIEDAVLHAKFKEVDQVGSATEQPIDEDWVLHALSFVNASTWPEYGVGVDAANGMMGKIWPLVEHHVDQLRVTPLYFELNGNFPNHEPNPAIAANLADLVTTVNSHHLDLGIAFDGDGDRAFFVDESGEALSGSVTGAILAQHFLRQNPGATVLYDVRMSKIMPETITNLGGKAIRTPVGGGNIKQIMRDKNAVLGTEGAGHYYFRDNYYSDSGLITALLIMDIMATSSKKLSELAAPFRKYVSSGEISVNANDPQAVIDRVAKAYKDGEQDELDGLSVDMGEWWFNLRASNTEPLLRLNLEATSESEMTIRRDELLRLVRSTN